MIIRLEKRALRTGLIYWLITVGWVLVTEEFIGFWITSPRGIDLFGIYREIVFASITAVLLYLLIARQTRRFKKEAENLNASHDLLRKSEAHLKTAQMLARVGSWVWDRESRKMSWSDEMFRIFDIERENFTGDPMAIQERIHPDDQERYLEVMNASLQRGEPLPHPVEFRIVLPGGEVRHLISLNPSPERESSDGRRVTGAIQDITESKKNEDALRKSETLLKRAEALAHLGHGSWDPDNDETTWSEEMYRIAERDLSMPPPSYAERASIYTKESWSRFDAALRNTAKTGEPYDLEIQVKRPDGEIREVRVRGEADRDENGRIVKLIGTMQDITEQKKAELALRESENRYRSLFEHTQDAILLTTPDGQILAANPAACSIFGRTAENIRRAGRDSLVDFTDPRLLGALEARRLHGKFTGELTLLRNSGEKFDAEVSSSVFADREGNLNTSMIIRDITDRKLAEDALRLQSSALTSAANAIVITDRRGAVIYVNPSFTHLTGYSLDEVKEKNLRILRSGNQDEAFYRKLWDTIISGKVWSGRLVNRRKDGSVYHEEQTITPVRVGGDQITHFIAIKQDVTERIRYEEALQSSMEQLHELTARLESVREEERKSISHEVHDELGQLLTAIKMDMLSLKEASTLTDGDERIEIESVVLLIDEAMRTVRDISARLRPSVLDYLGLIPAIEWEVERFEKRSGIDCRVRLPNPAPRIDEVRSTVLFRIVQEALTNVARHSGAKTVLIVLFEENNEYVMSVNDDGVGIRPEQIDDPRSFGLLGIRERLHPLGGRCTIAGQAGEGTEIVVYIPKAQNDEGEK